MILHAIDDEGESANGELLEVRKEDLSDLRLFDQGLEKLPEVQLTKTRRWLNHVHGVDGHRL